MRTKIASIFFFLNLKFFLQFGEVYESKSSMLLFLLHYILYK